MSADLENLEKNVSFEGWETALVPENFNLISILKFRYTKEDFSFNKSVEHTNISKFVSNIATMGEEKWRKVASDFSVPKQTQWKDVTSFWNKVDLEKIETRTHLLNKRVDQAEAEQQVQVTKNASRQMNLVQNIFINKSQKRGYDLQVDEASKRQRSKLMKSNDQEQSSELSESSSSSSSVYSSQETIVDTVNNRFFVSELGKDSNKATANQDEEEELTKYIYSQEVLNERIELPTPHKEIERNASIRKKTKQGVGSTSNVNIRDQESEKSSSDFPSSKVPEDNEEIKFDLSSISIELEREPNCKWEIGCINVTDRFRQYQKEVIKRAERGGLTYDNFYEVLALSSIMVLCSPCPYPMFTKREWKEITSFNPYILNESPLSPEISSSLYDATHKHLINKDIFMNGGSSNLSRKVACIFNDLFSCVPEVAPLKPSEEEHVCMFLYPICRPLFTGSEKEYELRLNRANKGSKKRPDLSCTVNNIAILNSEIKPLGHTPLQQKQDRLKVQLKARKSINLQLHTKKGPGEAGIFLNMGELMESFFMDLKYDGLYRSWPFLTTRLVSDKTTIPLAESAISHLIALEERVGNISEDYKYRKCPSGYSSPTEQMSFMRKLPDSPQVKMLIH